MHFELVNRVLACRAVRPKDGTIKCTAPPAIRPRGVLDVGRLGLNELYRKAGLNGFWCHRMTCHELHVVCGMFWCLWRSLQGGNDFYDFLSSSGSSCTGLSLFISVCSVEYRSTFLPPLLSGSAFRSRVNNDCNTWLRRSLLSISSRCVFRWRSLRPTEPSRQIISIRTLGIQVGITLDFAFGMAVFGLGKITRFKCVFMGLFAALDCVSVQLQNLCLKVQPDSIQPWNKDHQKAESFALDQST